MAARRRVPRLGVWSWSFVGLVAATIIVVAALAAVSEIVLPLTFAAVLAVIFKPLVGVLERHKFKPTLAAGVVVLGLLALMAGVVVATVRGVTEPGGPDQCLGRRGAAQRGRRTLGIDQASLDAARAAVETAAPVISERLPHRAGLRHRHTGRPRQRPDPRRPDHVLPAQGRHTLPARRRRTVRPRRPRDEIDDFIGDSCRILRDYGRGRTVMSAIVAVVIGLAASCSASRSCSPSSW